MQMQIGVEIRQGGLAVSDTRDFISRSGEDISEGKCDRRLVVDSEDPEGALHRVWKTAMVVPILPMTDQILAFWIASPGIWAFHLSGYFLRPDD
jgi:hypothetical protein